MQNLDICLNEIFDASLARNFAVKVGRNDTVITEKYLSKDRIIDNATLFDMASVTKVAVTTTLCYIAIDKGLISPETKVSAFFDCPSDKAELTVGHLLTHTMGVGHKSLNKEGNNYENISEKILSIPCDIDVGKDVLYSCPGFILLGKILEKVFGDRLDRLFLDFVAKPLEMSRSRFCPTEKVNIVNSSMEDELINVVKDYNCKFLGGIAGNAGLFSTMADMTKFVGMLQRKGNPLYSEKTFEKGIKNYTHGMQQSRALGFLYVDGGYTQTGGLFPTGSIGHCGHAGQSVFIDVKTGFYVIVLSDMTISTTKKYGNEHYDEVIEARGKIHRAIKKDLESM